MSAISKSKALLEQFLTLKIGLKLIKIDLNKILKQKIQKKKLQKFHPQKNCFVQLDQFSKDKPPIYYQTPITCVINVYFYINIFMISF